MKLKKLEISGFKSFVDKTSIEFPPGISAVVGPNGCGKSNVVDALQWVMGEQSVKQLRGKSMEDVIFSGSNGKPPLNMAEVSLIISNDNGTAPEELKDFTEIMLTRRLYRSGESAYLINKQPCRLKDIHNIFMGSGMGAKSYAVIQQGSIGAITDAGPEERRVFIEEAAGITRYKTRKKEALRKVQSTNQNLLRVNDIITEIKRQMAGLKRQARKAERFKKHQERIRELDIGLALHYYDDFSHKINETDALLRDLKDTDVEHTSMLKKLDAAVEKIKFQRSKKSQEISDHKAEKFETQRTIDRMENDLEHFRKDVERLTYEISEFDSAYLALEEKNRNLTTEIVQVENENKEIHAKINTVQQTLDQERLASQNIKDQLSMLNQELETSKTDLMDLVAQEAQYRNIYQNASSNKDSLNRRLKMKAQEESLAKKQVEALGIKETNAKETLDLYKTEIDGLSKRIGNIKELLDDKTKALSSHIKHVQTLELEHNKAKSEFTALKKMEDNFEWYKGGVRAIMKRNKKRKVDSSASAFETFDSDGILGLMADILEPEASYATAVEAVLGDSLQYILVKDQKAGLGSIDYLQTTGAGRGGFIPVASVKNTLYDSNRNVDDGKKLLSYVSVKQGFEEIAEAILGHVVIAETIEEAINIFNSNGVVQTIVTKDGNIISHQGIMVGGSKEKLSGILAKKNELKEMGGQIESLKQKLESARQEQKGLESETRRIESELQKHIELKNKAMQCEVDAEKALYKAAESLKHARRHLEIVHLEQEQLMGEEIDINEEMARYNTAVKKIESDVKAAQSKVSDKLKHISTVSSEMERFHQNVVDLKLRLTALNARLDNSDTTLKRLKEFQNDGINQLEQLSREITQKKQKRAAFKQNSTEYGQRLSRMYEDMNQLEKVLENYEADYDAIEAKLKDNDGAISDIQSKREKTLQKIRLLELDQSQWHIKRNNISERLEESYQSPFLALTSEWAKLQDLGEISIDEMEDELTRRRKKIAKIDDVHLGAIKEYEQLKERFDFLNEQRDDLMKAVDDLHKVIKKINRITQERFLRAFDAVNEKLSEVFPRLFEGGTANLVMTEPNNPLETGIEFMIHPPGKKLTRMSLLSGGEKALSAIALIFSIFLIKPASFCLMDEIDAPLDDANLFRFNDLLQIIGERSQIIMITHNKKTMEFADTLFGVTMEKKGISKVVSVNFQR
jgi:chromosome segregation protein